MGISQTVIDRTKRFEGTIDYMYLDSGGNVTIGVGHVLSFSDDTNKLALVKRSDSTPANRDEKKSEWDKIRGLPANHLAGYYKQYTKLVLLHADIDALLQQDLEKTEAQLNAKFDEYPTFPTGAQEGLLDMGFNLGIVGLMKEFPKFVTAVRAKNWAVASTECKRTGISAARNEEIRELFMAGSRSKSSRRK